MLIFAGVAVLTGAAYVVFGYSKNIFDIAQLNRYERLSEEQKEEKIEAMETGVTRLEKSADDIAGMRSELISEYRHDDIARKSDLL